MLNNKTQQHRSLIDYKLYLNMIGLYLPFYLLSHPKDTKIWKLYWSLLKNQLPPPHSWMKHVSIRNNPTKLIYGDASLTFLDETQNQFNIHIMETDMVLDFNFIPIKPVALIGKDGTPGNLYYYSFTKNQVQGHIKKGNTIETFTGEGWFDHQWGRDYSLLRGAGWSWFGIQLEDGRELLINCNHSLRTGEFFSPIVNLIEKDGTLHFSRNVHMKPLKYWKSLDTNASYPVEWEIAIPDFSIELKVVAIFNKQEMPIIGPLKAIWEGACTVTGQETLSNMQIKKLNGNCFTELVGYVN
jgi:predicted secreted hydrolase